MLESDYQRYLVGQISDLLPGCYILVNDPRRIQGIPDLLVLYGPFWAALEVKKTEDSPVQPNQRYYIDWFDRMSFAAFIYPENEEEVLDALQRAFGTRR
jgi:hypothetical protein